MAATVWKGQLTFGLVSIPVRLYRAARAEKVSFRQLYRRASVEETSVEEAEAAPVHQPRISAIEPPSEVAYYTETVTPIRNTPTSADDERPIARADIAKGHQI